MSLVNVIEDSRLSISRQAQTNNYTIKRRRDPRSQELIQFNGTPQRILLELEQYIQQIQDFWLKENPEKSRRELTEMKRLKEILTVFFASERSYFS